jgi:hypothetical protein
MAKKKAAKKKTARKDEDRPKRTPRSAALPGMEQVRDVVLDRLCESIGDARDQMNQLRADEAGDTQAALTRMRERKITTYQHAGVEMARVPGEEKLRVRTSKEKATASTDDSHTASDAADAAAPLS